MICKNCGEPNVFSGGEAARNTIMAGDHSYVTTTVTCLNCKAQSELFFPIDEEQTEVIVSENPTHLTIADLKPGDAFKFNPDGPLYIRLQDRDWGDEGAEECGYVSLSTFADFRIERDMKVIPVDVTLYFKEKD